MTSRLSRFPTLFALVQDVCEMLTRVSRANGDKMLREHSEDPEDDRESPDMDDDRDRVHRRSVDRKVVRRRSTVGMPGARVSYRLTRPNRSTVPTLFPTAEKVYRHLAKRNAPQTAKQIEQGTKLGQKTVESCLYHLRHAGLVKSELL